MEQWAVIGVSLCEPEWAPNSAKNVFTVCIICILFPKCQTSVNVLQQAALAAIAICTFPFQCISTLIRTKYMHGTCSQMLLLIHLFNILRIPLLIATYLKIVYCIYYMSTMIYPQPYIIVALFLGALYYERLLLCVYPLALHKVLQTHTHAHTQNLWNAFLQE